MFGNEVPWTWTPRPHSIYICLHWSHYVCQFWFCIFWFSFFLLFKVVLTVFLVVVWNSKDVSKLMRYCKACRQTGIFDDKTTIFRVANLRNIGQTDHWAWFQWPTKFPSSKKHGSIVVVKTFIRRMILKVLPSTEGAQQKVRCVVDDVSFIAYGRYAYQLDVNRMTDSVVLEDVRYHGYLRHDVLL